MAVSVFDLFKIGIGPSSSHTMGPMTAAERFLAEVAGDDWPRPAGSVVHRLGVSLHGSLAFTGVGHGTDRAVILGLAGYNPLTVDPDRMDEQLATIAAEKMVRPAGHQPYQFDPQSDLVLDKKKTKWAFKHAERLGAEYLVFIAPSEAAEGNARIKDLASGEEEDVPLAGLAEWVAKK